MQLEFPYQIVTFIGKEPRINQPVYYSDDGWYPQLALKRRFKLTGIDEKSFIDELKSFFNGVNQLDIVTGSLIKPESMPVHVIDIVNQSVFAGLHNQILESFKEKIISRYPDREGDNYYPHITAEYNQKFVIAVEKYVNQTLPMNNVWLLKDIDDENSVAFVKIK